MNFSLNGKKTYIGIAVIIAGFLGLGDLLTQDTISTTFDSVLQITGIILAIYGRYTAKV